MYAIVATGGKQVKVSQGDTIRVEKLDANVGDTVELDQVKMLSKEDGAVTDEKELSKAKVVCTVIAQGRAKKIRVFKFKRRKNYHRTYGHRQPYTELKVDTIKG